MLMSPGKLMLPHVLPGRNQLWINQKSPKEQKPKNDLRGLFTGSSWAEYGLNYSDDITLLFSATPNTLFTQTHAFSWFPADPVPKGRGVTMATLVQHRGFGLLFLWACWMGSDNPTPPPTSTAQLISSISVSLQMTDWITPVPHSSSHFLIPPLLLLCFCWPIKVKGSQRVVHFPLFLIVEALERGSNYPAVARNLVSLVL